MQKQQTSKISRSKKSGSILKTQKHIEVVNIRLPKGIVSILDSLVKKDIYTSRSEAIREFSREYVLENRLQNRK